MRKREMDSLKQLLTERLQALRGVADPSASGAEELTVHPDPTDQASHETDRAFLMQMRDRDRRQVLDIEHALRRIDEGTFGVCEECGETIEVARLKARPATTLCIECQEELERG